MSCPKVIINLLCIAGIIFIAGCGDSAKERRAKAQNGKSSISGKKVLYIDSYHEELTQLKSARDACRDTLEAVGVTFKIYYMDTKRKKSQEHIEKAVAEVRTIITSWKPDLIIASDDNASKHVIMPHYKDSPIPIVFTGVNWDVTPYGYPYSNVTGQIEIELVEDMLQMMRSVSKGNRIAFLTADNFTDRKNLKFYENRLGIKFSKIEFVSDFSQWKEKYIILQKSADMIFFRNNAGIKGWDDESASKFVKKHSVIPSGTVLPEMSEWVMINVAKDQREYGEYSSRTAIEILRGRAPKEIPITTNTRAELLINMTLARRCNVTLPLDVLERANLLGGVHKKVLFINSYHQGYAWSDDIEKGAQKIFDQSDYMVEVKYFRMDSKRKKSERSIKLQAIRAHKLIESWRPDLVIASDDNASKYLVVPYLKGGDIPVVFCGVNWDASEYGFPCSNVTGMVEVNSGDKLVQLLRQYARGDRLAVIGENSYTTAKVVSFYEEVFGMKFNERVYPETFAEWKSEYKRLQTDADMLIMLTHYGIKNWDTNDAIKFIGDTTQIPTGATGDHFAPYTLVSHGKIAEEQGVWAATTALNIFKGAFPADIPIAQNVGSKVMLNMELAKKLGIIFPIELIQSSVLVGAEK